MQKDKLRAKCRERWGKHWYKVHPLIKRARLMWAAEFSTGQEVTLGLVTVHEGGDTYVV